MQEGISFYRCRNCGRFIPIEKVEMEQFCSLECARQYRKCPVCGRYFLPDTDNSYCSPACAEANITTEEDE
jgi:predicted nucleic acid-binding Zn ribbon protein